jgi:[ribosomal protein S5]-alanine N-acetyltransferase
MPTLPAAAAARPSSDSARVHLRPPRAGDRLAFLAAVAASRTLHRGWVLPPATAADFAGYLSRFAGPQSRNPARATHVGFLLLRDGDESPLGVYNLSEIVRGSFHSAYLGYYAFAPHAGAGYMSEGLHQLLAIAYRGLRLHRVEANIQPSNAPSIALVRRAGFTREGYSRRYVKIAGRWRDHERWALLAEDWRARRRQAR